MSLDLNKSSYFELISADPFVTFTSFNPREIYLYDILKEHPELFGDRKGVHLIAATWDMEKTNIDYHKKVFQDLRENYPEQQFVIAATNEIEAYRFSKHQIENIVCNHSIFQDDSKWVPTDEKIKGLPEADAIYIARLAQMKRHHLCTKLNRPLLVYGKYPKKDWDENFNRVKKLLPKATYVNHEINDGKYKLLDDKMMPVVLNHSKVSLCLSKLEGTMRTSIQSLFCGIPIVSTKCIGGRERYYTDDSAIIVDDTPEAVQQGVQEMISRQLSRSYVREQVLKYINFDRKNFIESFNKIVNLHCGIENYCLKPSSFIGIKFRQKKISDIILALQELE